MLGQRSGPQTGQTQTSHFRLQGSGLELRLIPCLESTRKPESHCNQGMKKRHESESLIQSDEDFDLTALDWII